MKAVVPEGRFPFFLVFCGLLFFLLITAHVYNYYLIEENPDSIITISSFKFKEGEDNLKYRRLKDNELKTYKFTTVVNREELINFKESSYKLFIYRLAARGYRVYFNGELRKEAGELTSGNTNIWNTVSSFDLTAANLKEENTLTIEVYGSHELGLINFPLLIADGEVADKLAVWFRFFLTGFNLIFIGSLLVVFILLIFIYGAFKELESRYLYYIGAVLLMIIASIDYLPFHSLPISYLLFKKMIIIVNSLAGVLVSLALYREFKSKLNLRVGILILGLVLINIIFFPGDIVFKSRWGILLLLIHLIVFGSWLYTAVKNYESSLEAKLISAVSSLSIVIVGTNYFFNINVLPVRFLLLAVAVVIIMVAQVVEVYENKAYERAKAEVLERKIIKDIKTKTYNHQYLITTLEEVKQDYSLIMLDIDNFELINKTYGYQTGDAVINYVARKSKEAIRKNDLVGRYENDEFVIVLFSCNSPVKAEKIARRINKEIEAPFKVEDSKLKITASVGIYISCEEEAGGEALYRAHEALCAAQKKPDTKIELYSRIK